MRTMLRPIHLIRLYAPQNVTVARPDKPDARLPNGEIVHHSNTPRPERQTDALALSPEMWRVYEQEKVM